MGASEMVVGKVPYIQRQNARASKRSRRKCHYQAESNWYECFGGFEFRKSAADGNHSANRERSRIDRVRDDLYIAIVRRWYILGLWSLLLLYDLSHDHRL